MRLMPPEVMHQSRVEAEAWLATEGKRPKSYVAAGLIVAVWLLTAYGAWVLIKRWWL